MNSFLLSPTQGPGKVGRVGALLAGAWPGRVPGPPQAPVNCRGRPWSREGTKGGLGHSRGGLRLAPRVQAPVRAAPTLTTGRKRRLPVGGGGGRGGSRPRLCPQLPRPRAPAAAGTHSLPAHRPLGAAAGPPTRPATQQAPSAPAPAPEARPQAEAGRRVRSGAAGFARPGPGPRGLRGPLTQADDRQLRPGARRPLRPRDRPQLHARPARPPAGPPPAPGPR